jgi:hypothetical protein
MNEAYFWKIYFVLLHSKLNKQDSELVSTTRVHFHLSLILIELTSRMPVRCHGKINLTYQIKLVKEE